MNLNRIQIIGNLTRDPESRSTPNGHLAVNFSVAVNEKRGGNETTIFLKVVAWNKTGELCERYLTKGSLVYVEGRLEMQEWETRDGDRRVDPLIVASGVVFGPRRDSDNAPPLRREPENQRPAPTERRPESASAPRQEREYDNNPNDDLPF